jgi:hypothetical protein
MVRRITPGDCFFSSLSLLDIFMVFKIFPNIKYWYGVLFIIIQGKTSVLKTVSLKAAIRTHVAKYSLANFYKAYNEDLDQTAWVRTVQIITTRLLHVVLTTLHQHFGLGEELMNKVSLCIHLRNQRMIRQFPC